MPLRSFGEPFYRRGNAKTLCRPELVGFHFFSPVPFDGAYSAAPIGGFQSPRHAASSAASRCPFRKRLSHFRAHLSLKRSEVRYSPQRSANSRYLAMASSGSRCFRHRHLRGVIAGNVGRLEPQRFPDPNSLWSFRRESCTTSVRNGKGTCNSPPSPPSASHGREDRRS